MYPQVSKAALILAAGLIVLAAPCTARAAVDGLELVLTGGSVTGSVRGQGKAVVDAEVTNKTDRSVLGIRFGVFYAASDVLPSADADWRVHEFVFEPPLAPGKSTKLHFSDDNAAEYVLLDLQRASFALGLSYNGQPYSAALTERDGAPYIATRDLVAVIGGSLGYDKKTGEVLLTRSGVTLRFKTGQDTVQLNAMAVPLTHPVLEIEGRSLLPLEDVARLLGISMVKRADGGVELSDL